ncbi:MAG: 4Fe-4S binding protein [Thermodesulfobacteriota bacterium]
MKTGLFVCHCGTNIAATVDIEKIARMARGLPNCTFAADIKHACSEIGQKAIQKAIADEGLTRVVVAACTPRMHEKTFRHTIERAGLNPFLLEIANIREHCSWVHPDRETATNKAWELIRMTIAKVAKDEVLTTLDIPIVKRTLVIGGGIAGIQAALDIASSGYEVVLVEKGPSIGGRMAMLDKTFPTLDCSACILTPRMVEVAEEERITLHTLSQVKSVSGYVGNFEVTIHKSARYVDMVKCTSCNICQEKCPQKLSHVDYPALGNKKAVYTPFPQAVPNIPVIDKDHCIYLTKGKCRICEKFCPSNAINFSDEDEIITEKFGAIVVATGYDLIDKSIYGEYGYGKYKDVITSLELEGMLSSSGPTGGQVLRPSDNKEPKKIVFIQCVGSRDPAKGVPYCSKICCMYTAKHTILLKEHIPDSEAYIFYIDVRATGKGYEEFIERARREFGANYVRGRVSKIYKDGDRLIIRGVDTLLGEQVEIEADMVVLATAIVHSAGAKELAQMIGVSTDSHDLFAEAHPKLKPVESMTDGVFIAGACQSPRDIPDTVSSASAVAAKICRMFYPDYLSSEAMIAEVNRLKCTGCFACIGVCPFGAIEEEVLRNKMKIAGVNPAVCKGCGVCVAACYPGAMQLKGFTDEQILKEMEVLCGAG